MKLTRILSLIAVLAAFAVTTVSMPAHAEGDAPAKKHKKKKGKKGKKGKKEATAESAPADAPASDPAH